MSAKKKKNPKHSDTESTVMRELWERAIVKADDKPLTSQILEQREKTIVAYLAIDLTELHEKHKEEYETLTNNIVNSMDTIRDILSEEYFGFEETVIVIDNFNSPELSLKKKKIRELRSEDIGKLVIFDGLVKNSSPVEPKMSLIAFDCDGPNGCGCRFYDVQEGIIETLPSKCPKCGHFKEDFSRTDDNSVFVNYMKCEVEEDPEGMRGKQPNRITCELIGSLTDEDRRIGGGDRVTLIGIYKAREKNKGSLIYQGYIDVLGAIRKGKNYEDLVVSPEDEAKFIAMSKDKDLLTKMSSSVAPNIHGHNVEKSAIVLQMVGGNLQAGDRRGNIHILLIGDPGIGKSKLVDNIVQVAPHVVQASGAPTTSVGLTACIVKDEDTPGGFILEAGAAVLADGGMLVVDEFDKMDKTVRGAMHEIMEGQRVTVSKANINTTLNARCSVLAIMNPKRNRFNSEEVIADQIDLPETMLSRFDLIFALKDKVDEAEDRKKCEAIMRARLGTEVLTDYTKEEMTRYLIYVRSKVKTITPSPEAAKLMVDRFVAIRGSNQGSDIIPITMRQYDGMLRLAEACAKMRLSDTIDIQDAEVALGIITYYLDTMLMDPGTKKYDVGRVCGTESESEKNARIGLPGYIEKNLDVLETCKHDWISVNDLKDQYIKYSGASVRDFEKALAEMTDPRVGTLELRENSYLAYKGERKPKKNTLEVFNR